MSSIISLLFLFLVVTSIARAKSMASCFLNRTTDSDDVETTGNPLDIEVWIEVLHIRDVPNSGGSYGVDVK